MKRVVFHEFEVNLVYTMRGKVEYPGGVSRVHASKVILRFLSKGVILKC